MARHRTKNAPAASRKLLLFLLFLILGCGFARGHLCPTADMSYSMRTISDSVFMSNMSPQRPKFNRGVRKDLEAQVRNFAISERDVYIVTGPILPKTKIVSIGANKVELL